MNSSLKGDKWTSNTLKPLEEHTRTSVQRISSKLLVKENIDTIIERHSRESEVERQATIGKVMGNTDN